MKKMFFIIFLLIIVSTLSLYSDGSKGSNYIGKQFTFNWGIITDDSFSFDTYYAEYGFALDIVFTDYFMISPELYLVSYKFKFDPLYLAPGILFNYESNSLFAGIGVSKWFKLSGNAVSTDWRLKLNAGIDKEFRLTAFITTPFDNLFKNVMVGLTLGFRL